MMKRIGILGGSYNPPHLGHLQIAKTAHGTLDLDEVWLWVSFSVFKDPSTYAPLEDRVKMSEMIAADYSWLKIIDMEKNLCDTMTGSSLTLLQAMQPENRFVWIFGDDNFVSFHTWNREKFKVGDNIVPDWQYIMDRFSIAVMNRSGYHEAAQNGIAAAYGKDLFMADPAELGRTRNGWSFVHSPENDYSSTAVKEKLLAGVRNIDGLLPSVENYIFERGLFQTKSEFNRAAIKSTSEVPEPDVRFATYMLLATTANLIKSAGLHAGQFDPNELLRHAGASWKKSHAKGDFKNHEDVPGELADNLISLHWLAEPLGISIEGGTREKQRSVNEWCDEHYPGRDIHTRLMDYIEELSELCVCEGMNKNRMVNILSFIFNDEDSDDLHAAFTKTKSQLEEYAGEIDGNIYTMLDDKMAINRTRTTAQSAQRLATKQQAITMEYLP